MRMQASDLAAGFDSYTTANELPNDVATDEIPSAQTVISLSIIASIKWGC
ncbi:hypothetical protein GCM10027589_13230 [Actinocorallia lasiicapitis]